LDPALLVVSGLGIVAALLGVLFLGQNGRILIRLEAIEQELILVRLRDTAAPTSASHAPHSPTASRDPLARSRITRDGLASGTVAPNFSLPSGIAGGSPVSLSVFKGQPVLLLFVSTDCGPCSSLLERLAATLPADWLARSLLVVGRGNPSVLSAKLKASGIECSMGMQSAWEVSRSYGTFTLPSAFAIGPDGRTAGAMATGVDAIHELATRLLEAERAAAAH
jgi:thiol-disulfide isomerase/thioredoxin